MSRTSVVRWWAWACLICLCGPAWAVECGSLRHDGAPYTVCKVDARTADLRLFLNDPETGRPLGSFGNVDAMLADEGKALIFAMNAGMYHQDRRPVGHYVENGTQVAPVIASDGPGNFGLLPNGLLCMEPGRAWVIETRTFQRQQPTCAFATQSGPMLVIDGALHPRFLKDSDSLYIRNGVGTSADGETVWFAISDAPVNFHAFGRLFRDALKVPQALYFDGNISRLYAPALNRYDGGFPMGPMVGVVARTE